MSIQSITYTIHEQAGRRDKTVTIDRTHPDWIWIFKRMTDYTNNFTVSLPYKPTGTGITIQSVREEP